MELTLAFFLDAYLFQEKEALKLHSSWSKLEIALYPDQ